MWINIHEATLLKGGYIFSFLTAWISFLNGICIAWYAVLHKHVILSVQLIPGNVHMVRICFMLSCFDEVISEREIQKTIELNLFRFYFNDAVWITIEFVYIA